MSSCKRVDTVLDVKKFVGKIKIISKKLLDEILSPRVVLKGALTDPVNEETGSRVTSVGRS